MSKHYRLESLGKPAIFLIPSAKLKLKWSRRITIEEYLQNFLLKEFGAYTSSTVANFGFWKASDNNICYDEHREYEVSFVGKERIPKLAKILASIATKIKEECIYLKTGEDSWLVYPLNKKRT